MKYWLIWLFLSGFCICSVWCWDNDELEIFDVVEEVGTNFYTVLGVTEKADPSDIRKAYRSLSLVLHPDKNKAADAETKFRQLAAIYDILRNANKRAIYDRVLRDGLPDWRQAIFYYRRVRKMGLLEMSVILFIVITIGQYITGWASYAEKKYTAEEILGMKLKKLQKKQKKGKYDGPALPDVVVVNIPTPSIKDTLPFQIPRLLWVSLISLPSSIRKLKQYIDELRRRKEEEKFEEEEEIIEPKEKPKRRKAKFQYPDLTDSGYSVPEAVEIQPRQENHTESVTPTNESPPLAGGLWTDDDLVELTKLVKKFPPGIPGRWDKIAKSMGRTVPETTFMAKKIKEEGYRILKTDAEESHEENTVKKTKTKGGKMGENEGNDKMAEWSQQQQKALEAALIKFPKGGAYDRWEKISKCVPGKAKEECMIRYRYLVEVVKKKKENIEILEDGNIEPT